MYFNVGVTVDQSNDGVCLLGRKTFLQIPKRQSTAFNIYMFRLNISSHIGKL